MNKVVKDLAQAIQDCIADNKISYSEIAQSLYDSGYRKLNSDAMVDPDGTKYNVTVKSNKTGEVIVHVNTDIFIGTYNMDDTTAGVNLVAGSTNDVICVIKGVRKQLKALEENTIKNSTMLQAAKELGIDVLGLLRGDE